jgi:hypothetical protein
MFKTNTTKLILENVYFYLLKKTNISTHAKNQKKDIDFFMYNLDDEELAKPEPKKINLDIKYIYVYIIKN